jgi:hypothetical protein
VTPRAPGSRDQQKEKVRNMTSNTKLFLIIVAGVVVALLLFGAL